jgi:hypothetical protein
MVRFIFPPEAEGKCICAPAAPGFKSKNNIMKKIIISISLGLLAARALAQTSTNSPPPANSFTNGISIRLPVSDLQCDQLLFIQRSTGMTNRPIAQVATNYLRLDLNPAGQAILSQRRSRILQKVSAASDAQLRQVESVFTSP